MSNKKTKTEIVFNLEASTSYLIRAKLRGFLRVSLPRTVLAAAMGAVGMGLILPQWRSVPHGAAVFSAIFIGGALSSLLAILISSSVQGRRPTTITFVFRPTEIEFHPGHQAKAQTVGYDWIKAAQKTNRGIVIQRTGWRGFGLFLDQERMNEEELTRLEGWLADNGRLS